jgi:hypothetical protein
MDFTKEIGPRKVGGRYHSNTWGLDYTVTAIEVTPNTWRITCEWADGRTTSHCTPWNARTDRELVEA